MSDELFGSIDKPLELVWDAFLEDDPQATIALEDLTDVMDSMVLQCVADGRITVFIQEGKVAFSMYEIIDSFISYFTHLDAYLTISVDNQKPISYSTNSDDFPIPQDATSVVIEFLGYMNCSATFILIDDPSSIPEIVDYPLICLGFPAPDPNEERIQDFAQFTLKRSFPVCQFTPIAQHRQKLETRNKSFKTNLTKARKQLSQRAKTAQETIEKRTKQLELLAEHVEESVSEPLPKAPEVDDELEKTISRIENNINELRTKIDEASRKLRHKKKVRHFTKNEEIKLLKELKTEVTGDRQRVEALQKQENPQ